MTNPRRTLSVLVTGLMASFLSLEVSTLRAEGDETLGSLRKGFLRGGTSVLAAGTGLELASSNTIVLDVPQGFEVEQAVLYWGLRSSAGDPDLLLNDSTTVTGELIGTSPFIPDPGTRPFVYRADITALGLVATGRNEIIVSGLEITDTGVPNGAGLLVFGTDGVPRSLEARDGCDYAHPVLSPPFEGTVRQTFTIAPASTPREATLTLIVADCQKVDDGGSRPSTLEVSTDAGDLKVYDNVLSASDGGSWDTIRLPVEIPADARSVEAQLFSESRTGSVETPSSFYWVFASLEVPEAGGLLSFSGAVYNDTNGNGGRDGGESGIAGIEITLSLTLGPDSSTRSTFTGPGGEYRFEGIQPGSTCTAAIVPSPALAGKEPTEACPSRPGIESSVVHCDFGFALPPVVGDTVFNDFNGDGAQQEGEPGLPGIRVLIHAPAGGGFPGYRADAITDGNGKYAFHIPGVPGGATLVARVEIDPTSGAAEGKVRTTPDIQDTISLGPGGVDLARDFGLRDEGDTLVGGTVFGDNDSNGLKEEGDPGIGGVMVTIACPSGGGFPGFSADATTDANGKYLFTVPGILAGTAVVCTVSIDPETGGASGRRLTTPNPRDTGPLGPGGADLTRDFGLEPGPSDAVVGDTVFSDLNGNGVQETNEPGIPGVLVRLSAPATSGFPGSNQTATTGVGGKYLLTVPGIPTGGTVVASVEIDINSPLLAGKVLTTPNAQATIPLGPGGEDRDRDFGLKPFAARVGDIVFADLNGNGIRDPDEPGLPDVAVSIEAPAGDGFGGYSNSAVTNPEGEYIFLIEGIPTGTHVVARVLIDPATGGAAGMELTTPNPQDTIPLGPVSVDAPRAFGLRGDVPVVKTCLEAKSAKVGECVTVRVLLSSTHAVEGFVTAVKHDPSALLLETITIEGTATQANMADFTDFETFPEGGTAGIVMDLSAPFLGNTIPAGTDVAIVAYRYCCKEAPVAGPPRVSPLRFVDNEFGTPLKENVVVIGGRSISPTLCDGSITCTGVEEPRGPVFLCGGPKLGQNMLPEPARGGPGELAELYFYYTSPEDNLPGEKQFDHLQGISMAICYDCSVTVLEDTFRVPPDTITDAIRADYVNFQADNDPNDGDGCEMILAILVDSLPPFDGQTLPPIDMPLKLASVDVRVPDNATCGTCFPLMFCDGVNGRGKVPIKNLFAAENESFPAATVNCSVCVSGAPVFQRGDCNFDTRINVTDAVILIGSLCASGDCLFKPPCLDACDANDDGRLDLADAIRILSWLFTRGPAPPPPGPLVPGVDPTEDNLSCDVGCPEGG
ncbi:MAG TPA: SdrD B-like domain-containing protein [Planctomycetota bacterium]|nr:SdrD B-like domain-containing protein [Planctomycetota bacterium]